ncbi:MAG: hypothetical protein MUE52_17510 [Tabrizicola sp.]|nr:hypothetical protein [Tabrizicola sp.]
MRNVLWVAVGRFEERDPAFVIGESVGALQATCVAKGQGRKFDLFQDPCLILTNTPKRIRLCMQT